MSVWKELSALVMVTDRDLLLETYTDGGKPSVEDGLSWRQPKVSHDDHWEAVVEKDSPLRDLAEEMLELCGPEWPVRFFFDEGRWQAEPVLTPIQESAGR